MNKLKVLWQKQWFKNLVFFAFLGTAFFTDIPLWIQIKYTQFGLEDVGQLEPSKVPGNVYTTSLKVENGAGEVIPWTDWEGEPTLINFWASWCVPCLAEMESIERLQETLPTLNIQLVNLEDRDAYLNYLDGHQSPLSMVRQVTPLPPFINPAALPATFVIDAKGDVILRRLGASKWDAPRVVKQLMELAP